MQTQTSPIIWVFFLSTPQVRSQLPGQLIILTLSVAAEDSDGDLVALLLSHGASVDQLDRNGATPIHFAVLSGKGNAAKALIKAGADANRESTLRTYSGCMTYKFRPELGG